MPVRNNFILILSILILGFFAQQGVATLMGVMDSPRVKLTCADGQGHYDKGHLVVFADKGSNTFAAYSWEGDLIKVHAMPWQFGPDHDLWVEDCVQEIKEAAAAQQ